MEISKEDIKRFESFISYPASFLLFPFLECWNWKNNIKYPRLFYSGERHLSHRISFLIYKGNLPEFNYYTKSSVCHSCDNPSCVNPLHLFLGTHKDNVQDCINKKRRVNNNGEKSGSHKITQKEVLQIRDLYNYGFSQQQIADWYKTTRSNIGLIVNKINWKCV